MVTAVSNVPSSDNDDDSVSVAVISGAIIGTLLVIIIIIIIVIVMMILCNRRSREHSIDGEIKLSSRVSNSQRVHSTSEDNHTDSGTFKLQTINTLYVPTQVNSVDSTMQHDDVIITPNQSYAVDPNSSETGKECEYQYDYVQTDDRSVEHDKVVGPLPQEESPMKSLILLTMLTLILTHPIHCHKM